MAYSSKRRVRCLVRCLVRCRALLIAGLPLVCGATTRFTPRRKQSRAICVRPAAYDNVKSILSWPILRHRSVPHNTLIRLRHQTTPPTSQLPRHSAHPPPHRCIVSPTRACFSSCSIPSIPPSPRPSSEQSERTIEATNRRVVADPVLPAPAGSAASSRSRSSTVGLEAGNSRYGDSRAHPRIMSPT